MPELQTTDSTIFALEVVKACLQHSDVPSELRPDDMRTPMAMQSDVDLTSLVSILIYTTGHTEAIQATVVLYRVASTEPWIEAICDIFTTNVQPSDWRFNAKVIAGELEITPVIIKAEVTGGATVRVGDRVRHASQQYTGRATATVTGFRTDDSMRDIDHPGRPWIKILVDPDKPDPSYDPTRGWDWDRTILITE